MTAPFHIFLFPFFPLKSWIASFCSASRVKHLLELFGQTFDHQAWAVYGIWENQVDSNDFAHKNFEHSGFCDFVEANLKPRKYLMNPLIRSDNISRLRSLYMATIKQKEGIVSLLWAAGDTSLGVKKATVLLLAEVCSGQRMKCEKLVVFLIRGQSSAELLLCSCTGRGAD